MTEKEDYVHALLQGTTIKEAVEMAKAAILLYHCEVPLEEAKGYMETLRKKVTKTQEVKCSKSSKTRLALG
jgi:hypothetical protein